MEINSEILSGLSLINSGHIERDELQQIFQDCLKTLTNKQSAEDVQQSPGKQGVKMFFMCPHILTFNLPDDRLMIRNILTFSINSLLLESVKHGVNESSLVRQLQEHKFDVSTDNSKLFIQFINSTLPKVQHNIAHFELNPLPKFKSMEWSQVFEIKSSSIDSIKEKTYLLDLYVDNETSNSNNPKATSALSMTLSKNELMDLHLTLRDCAKSLEKMMSK